MAYKGKYTVKNVDKYIGDITSVIYRSLWERQVMVWLDNNVDVIKWGSEELVINYLCETDKRMHRYFTDFVFELSNGNKYIIEVKPEKQTVPPKKTTKKTQRKMISESLTYIKNTSKWKSAVAFAEQHGFIFEIWTEKTLKQMGIHVIQKIDSPSRRKRTTRTTTTKK